MRATSVYALFRAGFRRFGWSCAALAFMCSFASASEGICLPGCPFGARSDHVVGGRAVSDEYQIFGAAYGNLVAVEFGGVAASDLVVNGRVGDICYDPENILVELPCFAQFYFSVPPRDQAETVDVILRFDSGREEVYPDWFTYYDAPAIQDITPNAQSIIAEGSPVRIELVGAIYGAPMEVYFGGRPATQVTDGYLHVNCVPPPFPGGPHPLTVDVRVVNSDGSEGTLAGGYTYRRLAPEVTDIFPSTLQAWNSGVESQFTISLTNYVPGSMQAIVDGIPCSGLRMRFVPYLLATLPALPPGVYDLTIINGDGGVFHVPDAITYTGEPSTDFHPGDLDENFRFSLSEVLRVVQLFNSEGYHCDASGEDGYVPGPGEQTCAPYPTDNDPQDWQLGLEEVLQIIQFYNLHCYQPCPAAPGTYCPPTPEAHLSPQVHFAQVDPLLNAVIGGFRPTVSGFRKGKHGLS